jgi:hypothetical protein
MQTELPRPNVLISDAVNQAISACGLRPEEVCGVSAHLCASDHSCSLRWEVGLEPFSMRHLDPHFIRIQVDAETGATRIIEMK